MTTHHHGACLRASVPTLAFALGLGISACAPADLTSPTTRNPEFVQQLAGEVPRAAIDFSNSFGVVTHLRYTSSPYYKAFDSKIRPLLLESGIRHLRESMADNTYLLKDRYLQLAADGFDLSMVCDPRSVSVAQALAWIKPYRAAVGFVEGPNEFDHKQPDMSWVGVVQSYQKLLYTTFHADPVTTDIPILSPSFLSRNTPPLVGKLDRWVDYGNIHPYPYPRAPDESHAVRRMTSIFADMYGYKPFVATETGYHTGGPGSDRPISEAVHAKYLPRVFLENFNAGVLRSYSYEFMDQGTDPIDREEHFGMVRYDGSRKPAFIAIRNLLALVKDTKKPATPGSLTYTLTSSSPDLHHTLLRNSNGKSYLILWLEIPAAGSETSVPAELKLAVAASKVDLYRPDRSMTPTASYTQVTQVNLQVADAPTVIQLTP